MKTRAAQKTDGESITIRCSREWLEALDGWRATQPVPPTRTDVIRVAVAEFIERQSKTLK